MAKRAIIWTQTAVRQRRLILSYWIKINGTTLYAEQLIKVTKEHLLIIQKNPFAFKSADYEDIRESAMGHFSIYYRITENKIIVMAFWDNRQNPNGLIQTLKKVK